MPTPRKSAAALRLEGSFRGDRHKARDLAPEGGAELLTEAPPAHLTARQCAIWHEVLAVLPAGLARLADRFIVAAYVQCLDAYREAMTSTAIEGSTARGSQGQPVPSAHFRVSMMALDRLHALGSRLGLDPQSRLRVADAMPDRPAEASEGDPWAIFEAKVAQASAKARAQPPKPTRSRRNGRLDA